MHKSCVAPSYRCRQSSGRAYKGKTILGWNPQKISYEELICIMAEHDRRLAKEEAAVKKVLEEV